MFKLFPGFGDLCGALQIGLIVAATLGLCWLGLAVIRQGITVWCQMRYWSLQRIIERAERHRDDILREYERSRKQLHKTEGEIGEALDKLCSNVVMSSPPQPSHEGSGTLQDLKKWDRYQQTFRGPIWPEERVQWERELAALQSSPRPGDSEVDTNMESQRDGEFECTALLKDCPLMRGPQDEEDEEKKE